MTDKRKQIRVGLFAIGTAALIAVVVVVFGGFTFWKHRDHFFVEFDDSVMGLQQGAQVYLNGIEVGSVDDIRIAPDDLGHVRIELAVERRIPIRADTRAFLSMTGITGLRVIDLKGGSSRAPAIPPGGTIVAGVATLDKLQSRAEMLADQTGKLMDGAARIVAGANQVMTNLQAVTDPKALLAIVDSTRTASADLADAAVGLKAMVAENRVALRRSLDSVASATDGVSNIIDHQLTGLVVNANALVSDMRGVIHSNEPVLQSAVVDLRQASRSFKELAREVRERPSRMLFSTSQPERKLP